MSTATATSRWVQIRGKCAACDHAGGYCTTDGEVIKCRRNSAGRPVKADNLGPSWLFLASSLAGGLSAPSKARKETPRMKPAEVAALLKQHRTALSPTRLEWLATNLGLKAATLQAFGVGWDHDRGAYSFPMVNDTREPIGIHLRYPDGKKVCVPGSRLGLFVPEDLDFAPIEPGIVDSDDGPLLILMPEGVSDAMAARDMGFRSIGRPSNMGGGLMLGELLREQPVQEIVVVADRDDAKYLADGTPFWPGIEGALTICERLAGEEVAVFATKAEAQAALTHLARIVSMRHGARLWHVVLRWLGRPVFRRLQFMLPPEGVKDLRAWLNGGKGGDSVTSVVTGDWIMRARIKLAEKKERERKGAA